MSKNRLFDLIEGNIREHGYHQYLILGGIAPRYCYTVGLSGKIGYELVAAGLGWYRDEDVGLIVEQAEKCVRECADPMAASFSFRDGVFTFRPVADDWSELLLLGAFDYFGTAIHALQIVPDEEHSTLDVPDMRDSRGMHPSGPWRWLDQDWPYEVSGSSRVITNLDALKGADVTECTRWESEEWELFAGPGPDVDEDDVRIVSLGTILGIDETLASVVDLELEAGLWRTSKDGDWNDWKTSGA